MHRKILPAQPASRSLASTALILLLLLVAAAPLQATTLFPDPAVPGPYITLQPSKDNTIYEDYPQNSNGLGDHVFAGMAGGIPATKNGLPSPRRALLAFDFSSILPGSTITSVSLTLDMDRCAQICPPAFMSLHRLTTDWGEGVSQCLSGPAGGCGAGVPAQPQDATWTFAQFNTGPWTTPGGDYDAAPSATTNVGPPGSYTWFEPGLVADVQAWVDGTLPNYGWILIGDESTPGTAKRFWSKDLTTKQVAPQLTVFYTPPLAVTLNSFSAEAQDGQVLLSWDTASEVHNLGFNLYRSSSPAAPDQLLAFLPSLSPGSSLGAAYAYADEAVSPGHTYWYWLEDVATSGATTLHQPVSATLPDPTAVTLNSLDAAAGPSPVLSAGLALAAALTLVAIAQLRRQLNPG